MIHINKDLEKLSILYNVTFYIHEQISMNKNKNKIKNKNMYSNSLINISLIYKMM